MSHGSEPGCHWPKEKEKRRRKEEKKTHLRKQHPNSKREYKFDSSIGTIVNFFFLCSAGFRPIRRPFDELVHLLLQLFTT
jgi:hypothetical protein